jgi:hypothetical protein
MYLRSLKKSSAKFTIKNYNFAISNYFVTFEHCSFTLIQCFPSRMFILCLLQVVFITKLKLFHTRTFKFTTGKSANYDKPLAFPTPLRPAIALAAKKTQMKIRSAAGFRVSGVTLCCRRLAERREKKKTARVGI